MCVHIIRSCVTDRVRCSVEEIIKDRIRTLIELLTLILLAALLTLQSWFLHRVIQYLSNVILPTLSYKTILKSLHNETVSQFILLLQIYSPQISAEEVNLLRPSRNSFSQLHSSFCSSLLSYRERIGLIPSPICSSCEGEHHRSSFILSLPLLSRENLSAPCVRIPLWPPFLLSLDLPSNGHHYHHE